MGASNHGTLLPELRKLLHHFSYLQDDSAAQGLRGAHNCNFTADFTRAKSSVRGCSFLQLGISPFCTNRKKKKKKVFDFCVITTASNPREVWWGSKLFLPSQHSFSIFEGIWELAELLQNGVGSV